MDTSDTAPDDRAAITIVSGLPRSGTSLMMQMIAAGGIPPLTDAVRVADEDNPRGYFEFERVKKIRADRAWLEEARGRVVKMVHLLLMDLPVEGHRYRVVLTRRRAEEVVASQRVMLQRSGRAGAALSDSALIAMFEKQLGQARAFLASHACFAVHEVDYNALLRDAAPAVRGLNAFLGGRLDEGRMLSAIDPSLYRNRLSP